jgi:HAE1 family hydrophobic/amphiphilic exporter-1
MSIPRTSINKPISVTMLMLGMALVGIGAALILNVALFPDLDIPVAFVQAPYPGVDPAEMENIVTKKIEDEVNTVENIDKIESYSAEGFTQVVINFKYGTDIDLSAVDLRAKVDIAKRELPRDIEQVTVSKVDLNAFPVMSIALGGDYNLVELRRIADKEIKPAFQRISGVANVEVMGGLEREIRVKVSPEKLKALNLEIDDIINAVSRDNQNTPLGNINEGAFKYLLRSEGEVKHPQELGNIIVKEVNSRPIYLSEIAYIEDSHKDLESVSRINGKPSVTLEVKKEAGANPVRISDSAQKLIPKLLEKYKGKLTIIIGKDETGFIRDTIQMVKDNAFMGGMFAITVLFIFLKNYRSTIIIGISIPIAILATFALLSLKEDVTLNLMTLGGLALGIGMMIDNAIVVMENIFRFYRDHKENNRKDLAASATEEVLMPIIASTATTVAVFLPIGFVPEIVGEIFFNMSLAIIFSLITSLLVAVTFIPMLCSRFLKLESLYLETIIVRMYKALYKWIKEHPVRAIAGLASILLVPFLIGYNASQLEAIKVFLNKTPLAYMTLYSAFKMGLIISLGSISFIALAPLAIAAVMTVFNFCTNYILFPVFDFVFMRLLRGAYILVLRFILKKWYIRITYFLAILVIFVASFGFQPPMEFFPSMDQGEFIISFETPEGTSVEKTDLITKQIEDILGQQKEVDKVITNSRVGEGNLTVKLFPIAERTKSTDDVIRTVREQVAKIPGYRTINYKAPQMGKPSRGKTIQIEVMGDKFSEIERICKIVHDRIKDVEGLKDLEDGIKRGRPEVRLIFDREKIRDLGLSLSKVANMARSYVFGSLAGKYKENNDEFDIRVEADDLSKDKIAKFKELTIALEEGKFVKLSQIAEFRPTTGYSLIERKNLARRLIVQADPDNRPLGAIMTDISERLKDLKLPAGYSINFGGENEDMKEAFGYLILALVASILLVYMIMASQFESIVYPFIIMFTIPLSYMGVIGGLRIMGFAFSITAMIGIIMLAGIAVNNGIILIEYIILRRDTRGESTYEATIQAGTLRFRPILMTVFTTTLGMLPLALGIGAGADFYQPLAISVTGGLLVSTVLTLTFVPTVFIIVEDILNFFKNLLSRFVN